MVAVDPKKTRLRQQSLSKHFVYHKKNTPNPQPKPTETPIIPQLFDFFDFLSQFPGEAGGDGKAKKSTLRPIGQESSATGCWL